MRNYCETLLKKEIRPLQRMSNGLWPDLVRRRLMGTHDRTCESRALVFFKLAANRGCLEGMVPYTLLKLEKAVYDKKRPFSPRSFGAHPDQDPTLRLARIFLNKADRKNSWQTSLLQGLGGVEVPSNIGMFLVFGKKIDPGFDPREQLQILLNRQSFEDVWDHTLEGGPLGWLIVAPILIDTSETLQVKNVGGALNVLLALEKAAEKGSFHCFSLLHSAYAKLYTVNHRIEDFNKALLYYEMGIKSGEIGIVQESIEDFYYLPKSQVLYGGMGFDIMEHVRETRPSSFSDFFYLGFHPSSYLPGLPMLQQQQPQQDD